MPTIKGGELSADCLIRQRVHYVFGICGREGLRYAVREMTEERFVVFNLRCAYS
jgi:thiamine pyrophosphate-dependent acetolactate synthase large subunit-like protein